MEEKKSWVRQWGWIVIIGGLFLLFLMGKAGSLDTTSSSTDLNAKVHTGADGLHITNQESVDWDNCVAGINSGGWDYENAAYKTHQMFSIAAGVEKFISFRDITAPDGTFFDPYSQTVNNAFVECFKGTGNLRAWVGGN